jgi:peptidoglycan/xylan/chitin deacetylase (PgdA/CDA1 family)
MGVLVLVVLVTALPELTDTEPPHARIRLTPLLDAEETYPSPLRTALEVERRYAERPPDTAPARLVALTFDTEIARGEARQTANEILDILAAARIRATFFVVGTWARANTEVLRRMAAEGHEIANHSYDHRAFSGRRVAEVRRDLDLVAELVERETGHGLAAFFRPPYGCVDAGAARAAREAGYALAGWTAAGADALGSTLGPVEVVHELEPDLAPGAVVLLHTNRWITAAALPLILQTADEKGLEVVPLSALVAGDDVARAELDRRASRPCPLQHRLGSPAARLGPQLILTAAVRRTRDVFTREDDRGRRCRRSARCRYAPRPVATGSRG